MAEPTASPSAVCWMAQCQSMMSGRHTGVREDGGGSGFRPSPVQPVIGVQTDLLCGDTSSLCPLHSSTAIPPQTIGESCPSLSCNTSASDTFTLGVLKVSCCEGCIEGGYSVLTAFIDRNRCSIPESLC